MTRVRKAFCPAWLLYEEEKEGSMSGILYLCATPIGNLEDITLRVVRTLREVDLIAAEDTRNTIRLLNHLEIKTPMTSYHEYNKVEKAKELVCRLQEGKNIALVTDAGTPAVSDPGEELVRQCVAAGIRVTSLPGPAACITALTLSALSTRRFCFEAFLPSEKKERQQVLTDLQKESRTILLYEAPHRLRQTLRELREALGDRPLSLCRELTKKFEEVRYSTLEQEILRLEKEEPRGEYVLVLQGKSFAEQKKEDEERWRQLSIKEHMQQYEEAGMERKEAMKQVARDRGISKRDVYQALLETEEKMKQG